ncbi:cytochrome P450 [Streptomyces phytohabitans]|uniref:cytochrome P450 family protein n=1 Tax=Streptomyces phytohabitans TaxID=1150371 RepID=UPI00345B6F06
MTRTECPYRLDPSGAHIQREAATLRARGHATRVLLPGDIPAWSVTDLGLIRRLLARPDISKDAYRHWPAYVEGRIPEGWPLRIWVDARNALSAYGAEHARLRTPLTRAFTARRVRALAPRIETLTHALLDDMEAAAAADGSGDADTVDLRALLAWRLPLLVVNALLGVPEDMHDDFRDTFDTTFATNLGEDEVRQAGERAFGLAQELVRRKRLTPADDVTSTLVRAHDEGTLTERELVDSLLLLIGAGHETTVNLLDTAAVNLLSHPDQLAAAVSGRVGWDQVVEESLRHQAPIATILMRFPVEDVHDEETGLTFARGDALAINFASAGRDGGVHGADADTFDVTRGTSRKHVAFGHGVHYCLGAELARLEGRIALPALFTRFPDLALALPPEELRPLPSFISNGHQSVPVRLGGGRG